MKKALSLILSVAMLMTAAFSLFVVPASAEEVPNTYDLLNEAWIAEGAENVTINEDGTWTITGPIALAPHLTFDYTTHYNVVYDFTSDAGVSITFLDRDPLANDGAEDPNGDGNGYGDHWINLHGNWVGGDNFDAGDQSGTGSILSIYNWNIQYSGWGNTGNATLRAIYITPVSGTVTLKTLALNNGIYDYYFDLEPRYEYDTTVDLAVKDADAWMGIPVSGSRVNVTVDGDNLVLGNTAAAWPSAFIDFDEPYVINDEAMIYADFSIEKGAKTTIYLFFGSATCNEFDNGAYGVVHTKYGAEVAAGNYSGYIAVEDFLPTDEAARAACYDAEGNLLLTGIKIFATSEGEAVMDPAVTVRALDLLYTAPAVDPGPDDVILGDVTGDGIVNMMDTMLLYNGASGKVSLPDAQKLAADMDGNGIVNMMDVMVLYNKASGK